LYAVHCDSVSLSLPVRSTRRASAARAIATTVTGGFLTGNSHGASILALNKLSLTISSGEKVALIGHNGAGKSTFLRLISGIFVPTSGALSMKGYATPLLDKSFIVDQDLSGYEVCKAHYLKDRRLLNISLSEYIYDIENFTELGDFLHAAVSSYSDGMKTRLMFALLTSSRHPLLAMDEGIAAGDRFFLEKAATRFDNFLTTADTLVLASHDEALLKRFTTRGIVMAKGSCIFDGDLNSALDFYHSSQ